MYPYLYCFKILLAKKANIYVEKIPNEIVDQSILTGVLVYIGVTPPNTSATKVSWDRLKK